jgi:hypothetical protein
MPVRLRRNTQNSKAKISDASKIKLSTFFKVTLLRAEKLVEGAKVKDFESYVFSTSTKARAAIRKFLSSPDESPLVDRIFAVVLEEVILDRPEIFLPDNYHRMWQFDARGKEVCTTPGIMGLWQHGTTKTKMIYKVGDLATYIDPSGCLQAGLITVVPRRKKPKDLRELHRKIFSERGMDITDEYLWYWIDPTPSRPYSDEQRCQTSIFPIGIRLTKKRRDYLKKIQKSLRT